MIKKILKRCFYFCKDKQHERRATFPVTVTMATMSETYDKMSPERQFPECRYVALHIYFVNSVTYNLFFFQVHRNSRVKLTTLNLDDSLSASFTCLLT